MSDFERIYKDWFPTESSECIEKDINIERPDCDFNYSTALRMLCTEFLMDLCDHLEEKVDNKDEKSPIKTPKSKPKKVHRKTHKAAVAKI